MGVALQTILAWIVQAGEQRTSGLDALVSFVWFPFVLFLFIPFVKLRFVQFVSFDFAFFLFIAVRCTSCRFLLRCSRKSASKHIID